MTARDYDEMTGHEYDDEELDPLNSDEDWCEDRDDLTEDELNG